MKTLDTIELMNEQTYVEITALLSRGNVTLQRGSMFTEADFDGLLDKALHTDLGRY